MGYGVRVWVRVRVWVGILVRVLGGRFRVWVKGVRDRIGVGVCG